MPPAPSRTTSEAGLARRESENLHINVELIEVDGVRQVWVGTFDFRPGQTGAQTRTAALIGRTLAAELLRAVGLDVVDADAERLPPALADHYLTLKANGLL